MEQAVVTMLTPEMRAELRVKAAAARDAQTTYLAMCERSLTPQRDEQSVIDAIWDARDDAEEDLAEALTPDRVLALLDASEPVAGGEFEGKLRELCTAATCIGYATGGNERASHKERASALTDQLSTTCARLQAERDAAVAEVGRLRERLELTHVFVDDGEGGLKKVPAERDIPDGISCRDETIKLQDEKLDRLAAERDALMDMLRLIVPLAKGYAAAHPVGSNAEYVASAEVALAGSAP